jgi:nitroimidazol reductase NimA-like FMN-containing flavoprotein (pyridoxamine 5'-phosphate oxidase superfamily)
VDPQEFTEELEHPGARNLLDSATLLRLAYNGSGGFPRVIPIGFYYSSIDRRSNGPQNKLHFFNEVGA